MLQISKDARKKFFRIRIGRNTDSAVCPILHIKTMQDLFLKRKEKKRKRRDCRWVVLKPARMHFFFLALRGRMNAESLFFIRIRISSLLHTWWNIVNALNGMQMPGKNLRYAPSVFPLPLKIQSGSTVWPDFSEL